MFGRESDSEIRVVGSIFDRLVDDDPKQSKDALATRRETVDAYRSSVTRDLEHLLNTRNPFADLDASFVEVRRSVIAYGLPDFSTLNINSPKDQERIRQAIKSTIEFFEPRLTGVTAELIPATAVDRALRLRIEARLLMDPAPERVSFDIVMPLDAGRYEVKERA